MHTLKQNFQEKIRTEKILICNRLEAMSCKNNPKTNGKVFVYYSVLRGHMKDSSYNAYGTK